MNGYSLNGFNNSQTGRIANSTIGTIIAAVIRTKRYQRATPPVDLGEYQVQQLFYYGLTIPMTTRSQEAYHYQAEVTENPIENGSITSDHVVLRPMRLELTFEVCNIDGIGSDAIMATQALDAAIRVIESRQPIGLLTTHRYLPNMVCTNIIPENSTPEWGAIKFRASFKQINTTDIQTVSYRPENVLGGGLNGGAEKLSKVTPKGPANGRSATQKTPRRNQQATIVQGRNGTMFTTH